MLENAYIHFDQSIRPWNWGRFTRIALNSFLALIKKMEMAIYTHFRVFNKVLLQ